jgi:tetratricopeptide (TPR) repeat protein
MLKEFKGDVSALETKLEEAWAHSRGDRTEQALAAAEEVRQHALAIEQERFLALDELVACNSVLAALKRSGVNINVQGAEQKHAEAEKAMASGEFSRTRALAAETVMLASEAAQSQDVATAMSQIKLAEETLDETRALGLNTDEWERMVNRSRDFLKKLDFKSAEETARWARQKARDAGRQYRQALMALDRSGSVLSTYKDTGLVVTKAEELQDEAKRKLRDMDPDLALNLARKAEKMVREIAERYKGAESALRKAMATMRGERKAGKDVTKGEKLYDHAMHQLELGEYANAMKLATKAAEAITTASVALLELCPTCGEVIPENMSQCPGCSEKRRLKEESDKAAGPVQRSRPGAKGGRKYACPYCTELFEITTPSRPVTISCPWCKSAVSVVD